jgi:hypothetical protein
LLTLFRIFAKFNYYYYICVSILKAVYATMINTDNIMYGTIKISRYKPNIRLIDTIYITATDGLFTGFLYTLN